MSKEIIGYIKNIQPDELGLNGNSSEKISHLLSVTERLINDKPKKPVDAVFFFGRSYFDAEKQGLFKLAVDYIQQGGAKYIIIPGTEGERQGETTPRIANPGKTLWTDRLVKMGVPHEYVIHSAPGYNSKTGGCISC